MKKKLFYKAKYMKAIPFSKRAQQMLSVVLVFCMMFSNTGSILGYGSLDPYAGLIKGARALSSGISDADGNLSAGVTNLPAGVTGVSAVKALIDKLPTVVPTAPEYTEGMAMADFESAYLAWQREILSHKAEIMAAWEAYEMLTAEEKGELGSFYCNLVEDWYYTLAQIPATLAVDLSDVYLQEGGTGDGSSAGSPVGTLQGAYDAAAAKNSVIYVIGTVNIGQGEGCNAATAGKQVRIISSKTPSGNKGVLKRVTGKETDPIFTVSNGQVEIYDITIDGNGDKITPAPTSNTEATGSPLIKVTNAGKVMLVGGGTLQNSWVNGKGAAVYVDGASAQFILSQTGGDAGVAGKIQDNATCSSAGTGGGVVYVKTGDFLMVAGTITGSKTNYIDPNASGPNTGSSANGAAVRMDGGKFTMKGGTITGNDAGGGQGGGVYLDSGATLIMANDTDGSHGTITGNNAGYTKSGGVAAVAGSTVNISGSPVIQGNTMNGTSHGNLALDGADILKVTGNLETNANVMIGDNTANASADFAQGATVGVMTGGSGYTNLDKIYTQNWKAEASGTDIILSNVSSAVTPIAPTKHRVDHTLTNLTATAGTAGADKATANTEYTTTLTPITGYKLPDNITVTVGGGAPLTGVYNKTTGVVTVPAASVTGDIVITADGAPITYTVTYNSNIGSDITNTITGTTANSTHTYGVGNSLTTNGYTRLYSNFAGWNTTAAGNGTSYADKATVNNLTTTDGANVTLYAKWTPKTFSVNTASLTNITITTATPTYGTNFTVTMTPATGYKLPDDITVTVGGGAPLTGVYTKATGVVTVPAASVTGDIVITANGIPDAAVTITTGVAPDENANEYYLRINPVSASFEYAVFDGNGTLITTGVTVKAAALNAVGGTVVNPTTANSGWYKGQAGKQFNFGSFKAGTKVILKSRATGTTTPVTVITVPSIVAPPIDPSATKPAITNPALVAGDGTITVSPTAAAYEYALYKGNVLVSSPTATDGTNSVTGTAGWFTGKANGILTFTGLDKTADYTVKMRSNTTPKSEPTAITPSPIKPVIEPPTITVEPGTGTAPMTDKDKFYLTVDPSDANYEYAAKVGTVTGTWTAGTGNKLVFGEYAPGTQVEILRRYKGTTAPVVVITTPAVVTPPVNPNITKPSINNPVLVADDKSITVNPTGAGYEYALYKDGTQIAVTVKNGAGTAVADGTPADKWFAHSDGTLVFTGLTEGSTYTVKMRTSNTTPKSEPSEITPTGIKIVKPEITVEPGTGTAPMTDKDKYYMTVDPSDVNYEYAAKVGTVTGRWTAGTGNKLVFGGYDASESVELLKRYKGTTTPEISIINPPVITPPINPTTPKPAITNPVIIADKDSITVNPTGAGYEYALYDGTGTLITPPAAVKNKAGTAVADGTPADKWFAHSDGVLVFTGLTKDAKYSVKMRTAAGPGGVPEPSQPAPITPTEITIAPPVVTVEPGTGTAPMTDKDKYYMTVDPSDVNYQYAPKVEGKAPADTDWKIGTGAKMTFGPFDAGKAVEILKSYKGTTAPSVAIITPAVVTPPVDPTATKPAITNPALVTGKDSITVNPTSAKYQYALYDSTGTLITPPAAVNNKAGEPQIGVGNWYTGADADMLTFTGLTKDAKYTVKMRTVAGPGGVPEPSQPAVVTPSPIAPTEPSVTVEPGTGTAPMTDKGKYYMTVDPTDALYKYAPKVAGIVGEYVNGTGEKLVFGGFAPGAEVEIVKLYIGTTAPVVPITNPGGGKKLPPVDPTAERPSPVNPMVSAKSTSITVDPTDASFEYALCDGAGAIIIAPKVTDGTNAVTGSIDGWFVGVTKGKLVFTGLTEGTKYSVKMRTKGGAGGTPPEPSIPVTLRPGNIVTPPAIVTGGVTGEVLQKPDPNAGKTCIKVSPSNPDTVYNLIDPETGKVVGEWKTGTGEGGEGLVFTPLDPGKTYELVTLPKGTPEPLPATIAPTTAPRPGTSVVSVSTFPDKELVTGSADPTKIMISPSDPNKDYAITDKDGNILTPKAPRTTWVKGNEDNTSVTFNKDDFLPPLDPNTEYKVIARTHSDDPDAVSAVTPPANVLTAKIITGIPTAIKDISFTMNGTLPAGTWQAKGFAFKKLGDITEEIIPITDSGKVKFEKTGLTENSIYQYYTFVTINGNTYKGEVVTVRTTPKKLPQGTIDISVKNTTAEPKEISVAIKKGYAVLLSAEGAAAANGGLYTNKMENVPDGVYNVVISSGDFVDTRIVVISNGRPDKLAEFIISNILTNTKVEIVDETAAPAVVAGGLENLITASDKSHSDNSIPENIGNKVEYILRVDGVDMDEPGFVAILEMAEKEMKGALEPFDLSMFKATYTGGALEKNEKLTDLGAAHLLEIAIPAKDAINGTGLSVYHYHGTTVDQMDRIYSREGVTKEGYLVDGKSATIFIYTYKFSTYALAYTPKVPDTDDGTSTQERDNTNFWQDVNAKVDDASKGNVVKVDAKYFDKLPVSIMEQLRKDNIGMVITWNGGDTITIPAGKALKPENGRLYYPLSLLAELYKGNKLVVGGVINPETGGGTYIEMADGSTAAVIGTITGIQAPKVTSIETLTSTVTVTDANDAGAFDAALLSQQSSKSMTAIAAIIAAVIAMMIAFAGGMILRKKKTADKN